MKAIFPFMLPTDIKIDLNQLFVVCNKIKWYYERWRNPYVARVQGLP